MRDLGYNEKGEIVRHFQNDEEDGLVEEVKNDQNEKTTNATHRNKVADSTLD